jgi:hypothetical protein
MTITATITAFLNAATAAIKAFPLWLSWRQWEHIEDLHEGIIQIEARAQPADRPRLERMRVRLANARKHNAALLAIITPPQGGTAGADNPRDLRSTGG